MSISTFIVNYEIQNVEFLTLRYNINDNNIVINDNITYKVSS